MDTRMLSLIVGLLAMGMSRGAPAEDLVVNLPGLNFATNYDQYSGYLSGETGKHLHYWFTESQNDPTTDPLVLWLNGGPGCSSLMGFLTELGPFTVADDAATLVDNPYSWNKIANVIFLESPACVGFSYDDAGQCATGDDQVSLSNYLALQDFFAKFPEYRDRDFYITGESYAGIYIPTLAVRVLENQDVFPINFKGYAIGNGLLSYESNDNSLIFYGNYHALLGESLWNSLVTNCCGGVESQSTCQFTNSAVPACRTANAQANLIIYYGGLNIYNLYADCLYVNTTGTSQSQFAKKNLFRSYREDQVTYDDPPCEDNSIERAYLNTPEVRAALHIAPEANAWDVCTNLAYNRVYDTVTPQLAFLVASNIPGLIYNGDLDMACNFLGNSWDVESLGLAIVEDHRSWADGNQVGGYVKRFTNLDYLTFRGSGHMVPEDKPRGALKIITAFINGDPY